MFKKLSTSLVVLASLSAAQLTASSEALAAQAKAPICPGSLVDGKKRKTMLPSPSVGKKVVKAFDLYNVDDIDGALAILLEIDAKKDFDKASVSRYIGVLYAQKGKNELSLQYIKKAVEPNLLSETDQGESIKLLADLNLQAENFQDAVNGYNAWMDFTCKDDPNVWTKIAQSYMQLQQLDKVIEPADNAIKGYGEKHNQNPYILKLTSYYERKKFKEAVDVLETVVQIFPENKQWWTQLGMFYLLVEDYNKALATLDMAYKQGFLDKESEIKTLASLYASNEIPYKSAKLLEKHINEGLVKRDDSNLATLANAWHAAQHIDKAANIYGEVAKLTNDAKHFRKQGMLLKQDEQFKGAIAALNKALELGAKDKGRIQMSIAESHFYLEQYKQAYKAIQIAAKDPKTRKAARGWVSFIKETAQRKGVAI